MAETNGHATHTPSQRYLSTRGADTDCSFEEVVLQGLATDGGLYIPEVIPKATNWKSWADLSFPDLAFEVLSLYISPDEIPAEDLKSIIKKSYETFRHADTTPLVHLEGNLHLLELFHGPTFAFKDVALQFLGNLFEYFLVRKNKGVPEGGSRHHLTVVGATSGDTGSAAIYGLRGKKDVSVFILHPKGRVSPIQEAQMTTVLDPNVHNLAVTGTFDDCQDIVKALFADPEMSTKLNLGAVNSINWARILAQITYYFHSYFSLSKNTEGFQVGSQVRFVVPTGNFGDVLAGYFAHRMGLPVEKLVIATNENDILDRFWKTGRYEKTPAEAAPADDTRIGGVKETYSPAMDILVSSNFERLLWFLYHEYAVTAGLNEEWNRTQASQAVAGWLKDLKAKGGFGPIDGELMGYARRDFESERVSDNQTIDEISKTYGNLNYMLDPHSAVGIAASRRSLERAQSSQHISLSTAHPAKFSGAVERALSGIEGFSFETSVQPAEFKGLEERERRVREVANSWNEVGKVLVEELAKEKA
ncbi:hypothetical protein MKZ38_001112 [Zalerion maritima]|uniref:threonine synthase n=1 Tax=Zalerion maritima TaxID=339359 RepID=A0AAD5RS66_9PEZI|nr:hypothetical protein MKZ38_001112 [Zalerion maritima]